jgi:hypothetical protein
MSDRIAAVAARDEVDNIASALRVLLDALNGGRPERITEAKAAGWAALKRAVEAQEEWDIAGMDDAPAWMVGL